MSQFDHESDDQSAAANKLVRDLKTDAAPPPGGKRELKIDSPWEEKLLSLRASATYFNSDLTHIICRDLDDNITEVGVCARGPYAVKLERFLRRLAKEADAKSAGGGK